MHDADFPHDHDEAYGLAVEMEGVETITLTSVGIDIGSSTTHVLFSRLTLRREGRSFSTRYRIARREVLWSSPILLTPYRSATRIDFPAVQAFIERGFAAAGIGPAEIDTGAVVITGEALKKRNARPIVEYVAQQSGTFVCASAGPHHEALLAAHGSGAVAMSAATRDRLLLVDIGGGTTKLALIEAGRVIETAAISIGARLVAYDADGRVTRMEEAGAIVASDAGIAVKLGELLDPSARAALGTRLAETLVSLVRDGAAMTPLARRLLLTDPLSATLADVDHVVFSGGVSEYVYRRSDAEHGDLGPILGEALAGFVQTLPPGTVLPPVQGIRATVIGAGEYTIQVSGLTSYSSGTDRLPLFGLQVVHAPHERAVPFGQSLAAALQRLDLDTIEAGLLVSTRIEGVIGYPLLRDLAQGIADAVPDPATTVVVNVEQDVARSLGRILVDEVKLPNPLIVVDGVTIGDLDYVDIGRPLRSAAVFPVTVKSLLFATEPAG